MIRKYHRRTEESEDSEEVSTSVIEANEDEIELPIYDSRRESNIIDVMKLGDNLNEEQKSEIKSILLNHEMVFNDVPNTCNAGKHKICLTSDTPVHSKPYSLPFITRE